MSKCLALAASATALLALSACKTPAEQSSDTAFAHYEADSAFGGPLGRLEALKQGFQTNFVDVKICVETGKPHFSDAELVLEARLAYAAWLASSGTYTEADWQKLNVVGQGVCDRTDKSLAGFVTILTQTNSGSASDLDSYQEQQITCTASNGWKNCQGKGVTLGWGGPGGLTSWYFQSNPNKWTKVEAARPSSTTLSPYVDWFPLTEDIKKSNLSEAKKAQLLGAYQTLRDQAAPTMAALSGFVAQLEQANLVGADDPVFGQLAKQFYSSNASSMTKTYRGQYGAFSTILHEVGHQFGMAHAHRPGQDSITGATSTTHEENGQHVTDIAAMAYGLRYDYLTEDDKAGIKSDAKAVREFMASHK